MPTIEKLYSMKEVAEHNSADDCWIVVDGKVLSLSLSSNLALFWISYFLFLLLSFQVACFSLKRVEQEGFDLIFCYIDLLNFDKRLSSHRHST